VYSDEVNQRVDRLEVTLDEFKCEFDSGVGGMLNFNSNYETCQVVVQLQRRCRRHRGPADRYREARQHNLSRHVNQELSECA